jgi:soluble lytic murein transglycosylase
VSDAVQGEQTMRVTLLLSMLLAVVIVSIPGYAQDVSRERQDYAAAVRALEKRDSAQYRRLRSGLDDYPLAIYLDYFQLTQNPASVSSAAAQDFLARSVDTPLPNRFLAIYLRQAGKAGRWQDFLAVMPDEPNSVDLKCYYFRAQLAQGNKAIAWKGASELWVVGKSQVSECDPLFNAWQAAGGVNDQIVWTRLLNAFDARERSLLLYVAKKSSAQMRPWVDKLLLVYNNPQSVSSLTLPPQSPYSSDIVTHGLIYLASYSPEKALSEWIDVQQIINFTPQQAARVEYAIARKSLLSRTASNSNWLEGAMARLGDDQLVGIRLRWALKDQDWLALERNLALLSDAEKESTVWRYWQGIVLERNGEGQKAEAMFRQLAGERDYYGFLAADKLGLPYSFDHEQLVMTDESSVNDLPAVRRIEELKYHHEDGLAHSEWYKVLQDTEALTQQQDLALLATQKQWYRMAIDAATRAKTWNALDQRFPTPYQEIFTRHAAKHGVPRTELMSIARRESAFFAGAQSPVGARGLMQIMPATARQVAAGLKQPHKGADLFDVEHNVMLGSAYYREVLDRFGGNRVFALTAYNAGPHRVDRWRHKAGEGVPVELWIETIPYQETRNYVQAVLAYNVVFQYLMDDAQLLLTPLERQTRY